MRRAPPAVAIVLVVALALVPARASAATLLEQEAIVAGGVAAALDVCLAAYDLVQVGRRKRPSAGFGTLELTLMTIQLTVGVSLLAAIGNAHATYYDPYGNPVVVDPGTELLAPIGTLMAVAGLGLALHGLWTMSHGDRGSQHALLVPNIAITSHQALLTLSGSF